MNRIDLFNLYVVSDKRKFDDKFAYHLVKVFDACDIRNLYCELSAFKDKWDISLLSNLELAILCEICDDTHQGRMLGKYFPRMVASLPNVACGEKCKIVFKEDGSFVVMDESGKQSPQLERLLSIEDVLHEIDVCYGKHSKQMVEEQMMSSPEFFDINTNEAGSFSQLMKLKVKPIADVIGSDSMIECYLMIQ
ncbi:hypothetical protein [Photobacterium damselae]|uniref:hypothetical protein n=1 Tax=Photobacterium damselae TaxID=38293 RepID=UPI004068B179